MGPADTAPLAGVPAQPGEPPYSIIRPATQTVPLVFASPHSGDIYPPAFVRSAKLGFQVLRRSEDAFVDQLFQAATDVGAPC